MTFLRLFLRFILSLFAASVLIFLLLRAIPGDPARIALGVTATEEAVAALSAQMGTDRPLIVQYFSWIGNLLQGDFGVSLTSQQNITPLVLDRAQVSLILCGSAMVLSLLIAVPVGIFSARRSRRWDGQLISGLSQVGMAIPSFLAGVLLVTVFSVQLGWLPANGWIPPGEDFGAFVQRLILPVIALTLVQAAVLTRYVRGAVLEVMEADFMRTSRAVGLSRTDTLLKHGLPNASLPVLTVIGVQFTGLIVGAVVVEQVFVLPGLGSMLLDAVANRDMTTVQSLVMVLVLFTLVVTFLVDLTYRLVDPRLRRQGARA